MYLLELEKMWYFHILEECYGMSSWLYMGPDYIMQIPFGTSNETFIHFINQHAFPGPDGRGWWSTIHCYRVVRWAYSKSFLNCDKYIFLNSNI